MYSASSEMTGPPRILARVVTASFIEPMTFVQRLKNHFENCVRSLQWSYVTSKLFEARADKMGVTASYEEVFAKRFSLFLSNHHPVTHGSWPYLPKLIFSTCFLAI